MKKAILLIALIMGVLTSEAQTVIDNFNVGPYTVDYNGQGDVKYRLRKGINLYEFFELTPDTIFVQPAQPKAINNAFAIDVKMGAGLFAGKEYGIEGFWKKNVASNWYFNCGLSLTISDRKFEDQNHCNEFEVGIPLQIEYSQLAKQSSSLYALVGITPAMFTKMTAPDEYKKSGFILSPLAEVGGNIPAGNYLLRIGAYATYKINNDVYKDCIGRAFIGGKIGVIF